MPAVGEMHHVAISVRDLEESVRFYVGVLGMDLAVRATLKGGGITRLLGLPADAEARQAFVRGQRSVGQVELVEWSFDRRFVDRDIPDLGLSLISFAVSSDDLDALHTRCVEHDVPVLAGPEVLDVPDYAPTKLLIVQDPDGNPVELMSPATEADIQRWGAP